MQQGTNEWFRARVGKVTGSRVGAILGLNQWHGPDDVLRAMVREYHGAEPEFTGNDATAWGNANEAGAIAQYEMLTGNKVKECGFIPVNDWLGASPDGLIDGGIIEVKCPYGLRNYDEPEFKTSRMQPHYWAQKQIEMLAAKVTWAHFYQWAPRGDSLETVERDDDWLSENMPVLREFHAWYVKELDNHDHLKPKRIEIESADAKMLISEYVELQDAIDHAASRKKEIMDTLVDIAKGQDALVCGRKLTKVEKAGSVPYAKIVKNKLPDLDLDEWRGKPSEYWRLT